MAASRFFLSHDPVTDAHYIVPEMYRDDWERWITRIPKPSLDDARFYARRLSSLEDVTFEVPKFRIVDGQRKPRWA